MKTQLLKKWEISMLLALCITLCAGVWASARSAALSGSLVRLHVVAVSDDTEEQAIKLRVRDSVLAYLEPRLEGVQDAAGAREPVSYTHLDVYKRQPPCSWSRPSPAPTS